MQFRMYLQDVARICADDYNFISQGAMQYSEDFFKDCLEYIKTLPQSYQIHEMTSLTGGTFNPGLMLTFEKQLLIMGNVDITDHKIVPADAQLASDYQSVSSVSPPAKKAKDMHATISSDINAEKLSSRYEPHVCLTRDALVRLLDNHGPDFKENWELPVLVKLNQAKGSSQKKTVYIDSPLLKTEATTRDRSHIYHEESLKLSIKKNGSKDVFHLMTERPVDEKQLSEESSHRNLVSFENTGLDFEVDLTDLETFGEVAPSKTSKLQKKQNDKNAVVKSKKCEGSQTLKKSNRSSELLDKSGMNTSSTDIDDPTTEQTVLPLSNSRIQDCAQESNEHLASTEDSGAGDEDDDDDDKLVIDDNVSPSATPTTQHTQNTAPSLITTGSDATPDLPSPQKGKRRTRQPKPPKVTGDQLGEILRMQTAMFSHSASDTPKCSTMCPETNPSSQNPAPTVHSHPTSLVKPCVTSYLERTQNQEGEASAGPLQSPPLVNIVSTEHKRILSQELQAGAEDEHDYDAPEGGNLLYKLYSLQDLLLMVRSSVSLTHTRNVGSNQNQYVPVKVLPKLEYQMSYGVECLTNSEACQLWTETLLHSSTVSYIAHINAHTSKVALLRKLPDDWRQNISCEFKPSKSLNILHHLLKKIIGLDEGQYLIVHKAGEPFVTLLKAATGKASRGVYNLQQMHGSVPQPPASNHVPWIPVDSAVVLPFHQEHGRVPCTFPPKAFLKEAKERPSQFNNHSPGQPNAGKTSKNKRKRAAKRNKYIKKLLHKSV
ncbi:little elongation complex subunit 2 isoform X2 [Betta splendens]|nr:little elongation complex subunit 2 isoform X2 [Betta splendens]